MDVVGTNDTGILVRKLRESRGMTQQELELAIDASFGHISRIESGRVNPSKETLLKIIKILNLNTREKDQLLGLGIHYPTSEEIESAVRESKHYIDNCPNIAYLAHDYGFAYYCNRKIFKYLGFKGTYEFFIKRNKGVNILEMLFSPELGFRKIINNICFEELALNQIKTFMTLTDFQNQNREKWYIDLIEKCSKNKEFTTFWGNALILPKDYLRDYKEKMITLEINKEKNKYYIINIPLGKAPYFQIVEYVPIKEQRY